jgi:hypothetical protein
MDQAKSDKVDKNDKFKYTRINKTFSSPARASTKKFGKENKIKKDHNMPVVLDLGNIHRII